MRGGAQRWLLNRLFELDQPAPHFAFYGTVNWMRALALLVDDKSFEAATLHSFYSNVARRPVDSAADTAVFENVFLAFNHLAGLITITNSENGYDVCRPAISTWYHCIHSAAAAMVAAASGRRVDGIEVLAYAWQEDIVAHNLIFPPFSPFISTLVKTDSEQEIERYRKNNLHDLSRTPSSASEAWGGLVSYLHGTVKFERERAEHTVRETPEFLALGVHDFRTRRARELRDRYLDTQQVNFLVEAARYVGKASFRDSIFLSYGESHQSEIDQFLIDLGDVATSFISMACSYCSRRTEQGTWRDFVDDVETNSMLSLGVDVLRV
ncbi:hypothetical protein FCE95_04380 [Luteimonas gilva]|uniref:Uncharacterized protein n=1 Tax=Luteimonas gilva TaxID=2572684 RepID=A0A4U5JZ35_9GAMM|nr:hypothetical protein [Luteimonas gilva]TKR33537.1 hypothetical protein FCE95_04380 [Luteimonas gilva]